MARLPQPALGLTKEELDAMFKVRPCISKQAIELELVSLGEPHQKLPNYGSNFYMMSFSEWLEKNNVNTALFKGMLSGVFLKSFMIQTIYNMRDVQPQSGMYCYYAYKQIPDDEMPTPGERVLISMSKASDFCISREDLPEGTNEVEGIYPDGSRHYVLAENVIHVEIKKSEGK